MSLAQVQINDERLVARVGSGACTGKREIRWTGMNVDVLCFLRVSNRDGCGADRPSGITTTAGVIIRELKVPKFVRDAAKTRLFHGLLKNQLAGDIRIQLSSG